MRGIRKRGRERAGQDRLGQQCVARQGDDGGWLGGAGLDELEAPFDGERGIAVVAHGHHGRIADDRHGGNFCGPLQLADVDEQAGRHEDRNRTPTPSVDASGSGSSSTVRTHQ